MNIYQQRWDADQRGNGIRPVKAGDPLPAGEHGHIVVNEVESTDEDHRVLGEVVIPDAKKSPYDLCDELFNNYVLDQGKPDEDDDSTDVTPAGVVRIVAALVNPPGHDPGFENVTLINTRPAKCTDPVLVLVLRDPYFRFSPPLRRSRSQQVDELPLGR
jgi:hypothetical protein